jgi:hypothetical protein
VRGIDRKIKKNNHKTISPASVDKSVNKVAQSLKYLEFLYTNTSLPKN